MRVVNPFSETRQGSKRATTVRHISIESALYHLSWNLPKEVF